ncbi:MAG: DUF615 domain-containing protein [Deltaproteobacteria bacterium]|nr:DUF615 domain-containing protein [Deltaproteobacteria bacterium]
MQREKEPKVSREDRRRERKVAGEQGGVVAKQLMALKDAEIEQLELDDDLTHEVATSRRIKSMNARRREERRLAGVLRAYDLEALMAKLNSQQSGQADAHCFKLAEGWRARLIDEPDALDAFFEEHPELDAKRWYRLVADAQ